MTYRVANWNDEKKRWENLGGVFDSYEHAVQTMVALHEHTNLRLAVIRVYDSGRTDLVLTRRCAA